MEQPEAIGKNEANAVLGKVNRRPRNSGKASIAHVNGSTGWESVSDYPRRAFLDLSNRFEARGELLQTSSQACKEGN